MHTVYVWLFLFDFQVTSTFVASRHGIANTKGHIHGRIYAMLNKEFLQEERFRVHSMTASLYHGSILALGSSRYDR